MDEIGRLLAQWLCIRGLAEGLSSASVIPLGSGGHGGGGNRRHWADIVADVERAWAHLPLNSLGWRVVEARMHGYSCSAFAQAVHVRKGDVLDAYRGALEQMAECLEGPVSA